MTDIPASTLSAALCDACEAAGSLLWDNAARVFDSAEELDLFQRDLSRRGLLSSEALAAIKARADQLARGRS